MFRPRSFVGKATRAAQDRLEYVFYRGAAHAAQALPLGASRTLGHSVGRRFFFSGDARRVALRNFSIVFPDRGREQAEATLKAAACHSGWNLMDLLRSETWTHADILDRVTFAGVEHLKQALSKGNGVLALIPHIGNYELAMRASPVMGIPLGVVSRALHNPRVQAHMAQQRERTGSVLIPHKQALPLMLKHLRAGHVVAVLNDQYSRRSHSMLVPFLGVRAWTSPGPALAAIRTGAPIVPCCMLRDGPDHQTLHFQPPLEIERTGDLRQDLEQATTAMNACLGEMIRKHPEQWVWTHRRFRHSPDLPDDPYRR